MKRKLNDIYSRPTGFELASLIFKSFLYFCISFSICEATFQIALYSYNKESYYGFYFYSLFIFIAMISLVPIIMIILKPPLLKIYLISVQMIYQTFSIHGLILNVTLFWLTSCLIGDHDQLISELLQMGLIKRFFWSMVVSSIFDMVGYPWHRMVHLQMLIDDENPHHLHHADKKTLNFVSGIANSPLDLYPVYVILILFLIFGNLTLFYLYTFMFFALFSFEHCQAEGWTFIDFHLKHHRYYTCNYGDFFPLIDYIFGTLKC